MNQLKICLFCKQHKPHSEFNKHKSKKDGLQTECRVCISNYHKEDRIKHKEKRLNRDKTWRRNNRSYFNNYAKEKRVSDLNFKLSANLRNATWRLFKGAGKKPPCENGFTCEFLGSDKKCSYYHTNLIEDIKMKKQLDNLMQVMRGLN